MAEVRGFQGVRYRLVRPDEATAVTAPPYDVISAAEQAALHERDSHNVIRLELPLDLPGDNEQENRYSRAAGTYRDWLGTGVLQRDPQPTVYVYGQRYVLPGGGGRLQERLGLMAALKVEPFETGTVRPHEQTFPKHKEDRVRLLSAAHAQFSPIFALYSAPGSGIRTRLEEWSAAEPAALAVDREGVEHRLWPVIDPDFLAWVGELFAGKEVFIADGHHRYETALRYMTECHAQNPAAGEAWYDFIMTFLVEMDDPGLVLFPTHRLVAGTLSQEEMQGRLAPAFAIEAVSPDEATVLGHHQIGVLLPGGRALRLTLTDPGAMERVAAEQSAAWRDLDVAILHRLVFDDLLSLGAEHTVAYTRDLAEAHARVASGEFAAAFLVPPPTVEEMKAVSGTGERMPQKSTYFWPKAITGLVIYGE
jgi:uncharacterized protein (DUF1015 family)